MERMQNSNFENLKIEEAISLIDKTKSILDELNMKVLVDEGNIHKHDAANISFNLKLNPHNIFQNFIEGKSNKLARRVGLSIAEHLEEKDYTPYIICGTSGCGKSHLINAVGTRYKELYPEKNGIDLVDFTDFSPNPAIESAIKGAKLCKQKKCDMITVFFHHKLNMNQ